MLKPAAMDRSAARLVAGSTSSSSTVPSARATVGCGGFEEGGLADVNAVIPLARVLLPLLPPAPPVSVLAVLTACPKLLLLVLPPVADLMADMGIKGDFGGRPPPGVLGYDWCVGVGGAVDEAELETEADASPSRASVLRSARASRGVTT